MAIDFSALQPLGWSNAFSTQLFIEQLESSRAARVIGVERGRLAVDAGEGPFWVTLAGRLLHEQRAPEALPTVGDWVLLERDARSGSLARWCARPTRSREGTASVDPGRNRGLLSQPRICQSAETVGVLAAPKCLPFLEVVAHRARSGVSATAARLRPASPEAAASQGQRLGKTENRKR